MKCELFFVDLNDLRAFIRNCAFDTLCNEKTWGSAGLIIVSTECGEYAEITQFFDINCTVALSMGDNFIISRFASELIWILSYFNKRYDHYIEEVFFQFVKDYANNREEPVSDVKEMLLYIVDRFDEWEQTYIDVSCGTRGADEGYIRTHKR